MLMLAFITVLAGILLGTRFKFFVLVPAVVFVSVAIVAAGVVHAETIGSIVMGVVIASVCLQVGYLAGLFIHRVLLAMRAASMRKSAAAARRVVSRPAN